MVKQLSVFIQNESGKIAAITKALYENGIDLRAISIADTADFGILRLLVNDVRRAKNVLDSQHCMVDVTDVVVVGVPDVPGGVAGILEILAKEDVDLEYMYSLIDRGTSDAYMVFRASDTERMVQVLDQYNISMVPGEKLGLN